MVLHAECLRELSAISSSASGVCGRVHGAKGILSILTARKGKAQAGLLLRYTRMGSHAEFYFSAETCRRRRLSASTAKNLHNRQLRWVARSLSAEAAESLVQAFISRFTSQAILFGG